MSVPRCYDVQVRSTINTPGEILSLAQVTFIHNLDRKPFGYSLASITSHFFDVWNRKITAETVHAVLNADFDLTSEMHLQGERTLRSGQCVPRGICSEIDRHKSKAVKEIQTYLDLRWGVWMASEVITEILQEDAMKVPRYGEAVDTSYLTPFALEDLLKPAHDPAKGSLNAIDTYQQLTGYLVRLRNTPNVRPLLPSRKLCADAKEFMAEEEINRSSSSSEAESTGISRDMIDESETSMHLTDSDHDDDGGDSEKPGFCSPPHNRFNPGYIDDDSDQQTVSVHIRKAWAGHDKASIPVYDPTKPYYLEALRADDPLMPMLIPLPAADLDEYDALYRSQTVSVPYESHIPRALAHDNMLKSRYHTACLRNLVMQREIYAIPTPPGSSLGVLDERQALYHRYANASHTMDCRTLLKQMQKNYMTTYVYQTRAEYQDFFR